jgi:protein SCO1
MSAKNAMTALPTTSARMNALPSTPTRRHCLSALAGGFAMVQGFWPGAAQAYDAMGAVDPPTPALDFKLTDHLGRARGLREMLSGRVTVVQTMFTGCSTVCPIQGAVFAELQRRLTKINSKQAVQLLSLSIDPLGDSPTALKAWLERLQAESNWSAGVPQMADVVPLQRSLDGPASRNKNGADEHSDRLYFFDAQARLRWRSGALPAVAEVLRVVGYLAA